MGACVAQCDQQAQTAALVACCNLDNAGNPSVEAYHSTYVSTQCDRRCYQRSQGSAWLIPSRQEPLPQPTKW